VIFADSSTKNMIQHLHEIHKIGKDGPIPLKHGKVLIETAFGKTRPQVTFNTDLFRDPLLRWIIENHISFSQVQKSSFRVLLRYLVACVSIFYFFQFALTVGSIVEYLINLTYMDYPCRARPILRCHTLFPAPPIPSRVGF